LGQVKQKASVVDPWLLSEEKRLLQLYASIAITTMLCDTHYGCIVGVIVVVLTHTLVLLLLLLLLLLVSCAGWGTR
jgi:hypothetical protein